MSGNGKKDSQEYLAEFFGTFVFLFLGIGCVAGLKVAGASLGQWEIAIVWGVAVSMGVYLSAGVSGAHLNPSVTIALAVFACFPKRKVIPFILAQTFGAFCAAALAYLLFYNLFDAALTAAAGDAAKRVALAGSFCTFPNPGITMFQAGLTEMVITALLMALIMALTDDGNGVPKGPMAPLLIGLLVAVIGASFGPLTGFAMNAARDFGPRLFAYLAGWGSDVMTGYPLSKNITIPYFLVPLVMPVFGGLLGAWLYKNLIGRSLACKID
jgi:glycerol uptake facilitator protein